MEFTESVQEERDEYDSCIELLNPIKRYMISSDSFSSALEELKNIVLQKYSFEEFQDVKVRRIVSNYILTGLQIDQEDRTLIYCETEGQIDNAYHFCMFVKEDVILNVPRVANRTPAQ